MYPKYLKFDNIWKLCFIVDIEEEEYKRCQDFAKNQWNNKKKGKYGGGILNKEGRSNYPELVGGLGEMAFCKVFNQKMDTEYQEGGKKHDYEIKGKKIDIKMSSTKKEYANKACYIYGKTEGGKILPIKSDIYVCGMLMGKAQVVLIGWETKKTIQKFSLKPSRSPSHSHMNYELVLNKLRNISDLYLLLNYG